ncbi:MAG TPA: hypothetical protein VF401_03465, partial [Candidatus Saccharimonadales bacterium]
MDIDFSNGVAFLRREQQPDGSFMGRAGTNKQPFLPHRQHPTIFFTSLIALCLQEVPDTQDIRQEATDFLHNKKSSGGSWNYWQRSAAIAKRYPYPDDMDDTACALLALQMHTPSYINGHGQAQLAKLLIATETQPGGPYRTWLLTSDPKKQWNDVDVVINANIGALLATQNVSLPGLNSYLDDAIAAKQLTSPYYVGTVPALYFLSKWYHGPELRTLKRYVRQELGKKELSAMHLAMLLTAAKKLELPLSHQAIAQKQLLALYKTGRLVADPLYVDPAIGGVQYYAGSEALTMAFALEALARKQPSAAITKLPGRRINQTVKRALENSTQLPPAIQKPYQTAVRAISNSASSSQITQLATITNSAYGASVDPKILMECNLGSLNGWIAYTIYDDFLDEEGQPELLGTANYALRQSLDHFTAALPGRQEFHELIRSTFNTIDAANTWEVTHARYNPAKSLKIIRTQYGHHHQLAERSLGHMLAACGVLYALGYNQKSPQLQALQKFFHHFLIARQLN